MEREMPLPSEIELFKQNMKQPEILENSDSRTLDSLRILEERNRQTARELELLRKKVVAKRAKEVAIATVLATIAIGAGLKITEAFASDNSRSKDALASLELAPDAKVNINYESLKELDPELTPKRVDTILATMPQGFINGEVASIEFQDVKEEMGEKYGPELNKNDEAAASAVGGAGTKGTKIIFASASKPHSSARIVKTLVHEIGHANAFDTLRNLTDSERVALENKLVIRLEDPNHFQSAYVEEIANEDKAKERKVKEDEYWAEIFEAYIDGNPNLPAEDSALVAPVIAKKDPNFDRDEQLRRRNIEVVEMTNEEIKTGFKNLSPVMQGRDQVWLETHRGEAVKVIDQKKQRIGRAELVSFFKTNLVNQDEIEFVKSYMYFCQSREAILSSDVKSKDDVASGIDQLKMAQAVEKNVPKLGLERAKELLDKIDVIIGKYDLVVGTYRDLKISPEEEKEFYSDHNKDIRGIIYALLSKFD